MRTICALCSMIVLFSFTGIQAQTETAPAAGDSIQVPASNPTPAPGTPMAAEIPAVKTVPVMPIRENLKNNGLTGTVLFSCNGLYFYNKSVETRTDYDWYSGTRIEYDVTYKTYMYAILFNLQFPVVSATGTPMRKGKV